MLFTFLNIIIIINHVHLKQFLTFINNKNKTSF